MAEEHICQVYDFTSIREVIMEKKQVETQLQDKLAEMDAKKIEEDNITLDLFTIRDMILNGFNPTSAKDIVEYGSKVGYEIDWESETWNPVDD